MSQRIVWPSDVEDVIIKSVKKSGVSKGIEEASMKLGISYSSLIRYYYTRISENTRNRIIASRMGGFSYDKEVLKATKEFIAKYPNNYRKAFINIADATGYKPRTIEQMWYGSGTYQPSLRDAIGPIAVTSTKKVVLENRKSPKAVESVFENKKGFTHIFSIITKALKLYKNDTNKTGKASKKAKS